MSDRLKGLREKRGKVIKDSREVLAAADREKRDPTAEELAKHDELFAEQERLRKEIEAEERQQELAREDAATAAAAERAQATGRGTDYAAVHQLAVRDAPKHLRDWLNRCDPVVAGKRSVAFRNWLRSGTIAGEGAEEFRNLQADGNDPQAGFLVAPEQFVAQLIKFVDDMLFIRQRANIIPVGMAQSLGIPSLDADPADADWTSELETGSEDTAMKFGKRELHPRPLAKRIKVSNKLLRTAALNPEAIVRERLGYKFGVTQEKAYLTGSGANQPLGIFTASADGISTGRDVSTGNTATAITIDGLLEAKYSLKSQYWANAAWMFHRDAVKQVAKIREGSGTGQYLWQPSIQAGQPDRLLNFPLMVSEFVPNTFTTGKYVGALADFSHYWIADALDFAIQRLVELYAETNQTGFIGRYEGDGMPVLEEAFARVTLA